MAAELISSQKARLKIRQNHSECTHVGVAHALINSIHKLESGKISKFPLATDWHRSAREDDRGKLRVFFSIAKRIVN